MKVTIITTCLNRVHTIGRAIESIIRQDYADIEYIVVDGGSTDGTLDVINRYRDHISHLVSEPDHGMYEAINKGLRLATGDVIGLVHSDDVLYDNTVISQVAEVMAVSAADMVYGDGLFVRGDRVIRNWISGTNRRWKLRAGWLPLHPTCYVRSDVFARYGAYNEHYQIAADTDWLFRNLYVNRIRTVYLRRYIVKMDMGGLSTDSSRRRQMWREDTAIYQSFHLSGKVMKVMKMMWKLPQFMAFLKR